MAAWQPNATPGPLCITQSTEAVHSPAKSDSDPRQLVLDGLAEENEAGNADDPGGIDTPQSVFGRVLAVVSSNVTVAEEVVEPVAPYFCEYSPYHWRKVEQSYGGVGEKIWRRLDELGDC
jgi:hypothetical protein